MKRLIHKASQLILHFGLAKTGTSAIQRALFRHRNELLRDYSTLYPGRYENHYYLQAMFSKTPASLDQIQILKLDNSKAIHDFISACRQEIVDEINEAKPRQIIISSEYFSGMDVDELKAMRDFFETIADDIVLFGYVRDPWSYSISWIQEMIRNGKLKDKVEFGYLMSNVEILAKFEQVFDKRAVVAPYIQRSGGFDVISDFCQRFDLAIMSNSGAINQEFTRVNHSMHREAACVMLRQNQLYPVFDEHNNYIPDAARDWMVESLQISPLDNTPIRMSKRMAEQIFVQAKADIELMEMRYFGGSKLFTEFYESMEFADADDTLSVSLLEPDELAEYLLSCMRVLSERAIEHYIAKNYWMGRYYFEVGKIEAARGCFEKVLSADPSHDWARKEMKALDSAVGKWKTYYYWRQVKTCISKTLARLH